MKRGSWVGFLKESSFSGRFIDLEFTPFPVVGFMNYKVMEHAMFNNAIGLSLPYK